MDSYPSTTSDQFLIKLAEESTYGYQMTYARLPGGQSGQDSYTTWYRGGLPREFFNGVLYTRFPAENLDGHIQETLKPFQEQNLPMRWYIGPSSQPDDLEHALLRNGLRFSWAGPALVVNLSDLRKPSRRTNGLIIQQVQDPDALAKWVNLFLSRGSSEAKELLTRAYTATDFGKDLDLRLYVGRLEGQAVATACMFYGSQAVAIKHVFTLPAFERLGIGTAMTLHALDEAFELGHSYAALTSSKEGYPVYSRLGFQEVCRFARYVWKPEN